MNKDTSNQVEIQLRKVEVLIENWSQIEMKDLKPGQIFRMFDPGEIPVVDPVGNSKWKVMEDPFLTDGVWGVVTDPA